MSRVQAAMESAWAVKGIFPSKASGSAQGRQARGGNHARVSRRLGGGACAMAVRTGGNGGPALGSQEHNATGRSAARLAGPPHMRGLEGGDARQSAVCGPAWRHGPHPQDPARLQADAFTDAGDHGAR